MRKGYLLTEKQANELYLVLKFAIPQMKEGKPKTEAKKIYSKVAQSLNLL